MSDYDSVEVTAELKGAKTLTVTMKQNIFEKLGLKEGDTAWACFDSSDALLAI